MMDPETAIELAREYPDISSGLLAAHCRNLARMSRIHQTRCERYCNEDTFNPRLLDTIEAKIASFVADTFAGTRAKFQRDPRGATVKLVVPSGRTNDWGREGLCVVA